MPNRRRTAEEERYWRVRSAMEFARLIIWILWDTLRHGGGSPF
jgi:hypothetical protein